MELYELLKLAEIRSIKKTDGHLTLMRFTTGWKCMYGTPVLADESYSPIIRLPGHEMLEDALGEMLNTDITFKAED